MWLRKNLFQNINEEDKWQLMIFCLNILIYSFSNSRKFVFSRQCNSQIQNYCVLWGTHHELYTNSHPAKDSLKIIPMGETVGQHTPWLSLLKLVPEMYHQTLRFQRVCKTWKKLFFFAWDTNNYNFAIMGMDYMGHMRVQHLHTILAVNICYIRLKM